MGDYTPTKISDLNVNDDIMWLGKSFRVVERLGPVTVKIREYKRKEVALETFKNKWRTISDDIFVDKVTTR